MEFNISQTIPPPTGDILALITSLSNPSNHTLHTKALQIQSTTLSSSPISYGNTCLQYARVLACPSPSHIAQSDIDTWSQSDGGISVMQLRHDPITGWNTIRQMAGYLLKNALLQPPLNKDTNMKMRLLPHASHELKIILCQSIMNEHEFVRKVSSSIIASCTVGMNVMDGMEAFPLSEWGHNILTPFLVQCLDRAIVMMESSSTATTTANEEKNQIMNALLGSLMTLSKLLEDNAQKFETYSGSSFHKVIPNLLKLLQICNTSNSNQSSSSAITTNTKIKVDSLKCCVHLIDVMPSSLVVAMNEFLVVLSSLGNDNNYEVRQLVCRSIVNM